MIDDSRLMIADMRSGAAAAEPRSRCGQNRVKTWFKSAFVRHHKSSIINHKSIVILGCLLAAPSLAAPASTNLADLNELKLDSAVEIALETNPSLGAAAARVTQARARLRQARSLYWPSVTGAGSAMHVDAADATYRPELGIDNPETHYRAELGATWVLFDGFAREFRVALGRHGTQESEAALREARRRLVLTITQTFLATQLARESIAIGKADVAFNTRLLQDTRARRDLGGASLSDELNFETRANAARARLIDAQRERDSARLALAALMGLPTLPPNLPLAPLQDPQAAPPPHTSELLAAAVANRPDLVSARAGLAGANASRGAARAAYSPVVALSAGVNGERTENPGLESDDFGTTAGVTVNYTFFDGGQRRGALNEADATVAQARQQLRETELNVRREVRDAVLTLTSAREQLQLQRRNTALIEQNRNLVDKEYAAGQNSLTRLNEAQRDLVAAQVALARARIAVIRAQAELDAAVGKEGTLSSGPDL